MVLLSAKCHLHCDRFYLVYLRSVDETYFLLCDMLRKTTNVDLICSLV